MSPSPTLMSYLQLLRLPNGFTAMSNILAAQLLVSQGRPEWLPLVLLMLASLCLYSGGIVLNDCFDYAEDLRERPARPLPAGRIPRVTAWALGSALMLAGIVLAAGVGIQQLVIAVVITALVLLYDGYAKHTPLGSVAMGACRYGNWLLGLSYGGQYPDNWLLAIPVFLYVTSLTLLSRAETSGGRRLPLLLCGAGMLFTAGAILLLHYLQLFTNPWAMLPLLAGLALVGWRLQATYRDFIPVNIQRMVKTLVLGIIPLDALLVFAGGPWWGPLPVLALYFPGAWLARRLYVT